MITVTGTGNDYIVAQVIGCSGQGTKYGESTRRNNCELAPWFNPYAGYHTQLTVSFLVGGMALFSPTFSCSAGGSCNERLVGGLGTIFSASRTN